MLPKIKFIITILGCYPYFYLNKKNNRQLMLSINIPVYNIEIKSLIVQLMEQAEALSIDYEVRVYDDCSDEGIKIKNRELKAIPHLVYKELDKNIGRSAIRNKMGFDSNKRYLLFIDADSRLVSGNYLQNYLKLAKKGCIICGGTYYSSQKPADEKKILRWKYGLTREAVSAGVRSKKRGFIITSNNFFADRELFRKVHFREQIRSYGHEDTLLGLDLFTHGAEPIHIDNPVEHTGLEDSYSFLDKTRSAIENLLFISNERTVNSTLLKSKMSFIKQYDKITGLVAPSLIKWLFNQTRELLEKQLTGKDPSLFLFDLYKLGYYSKIDCSLKRDKKNDS